MAPPAAAQDDGVFLDPDSPAGKEYAVPLEEARRQAIGGGGDGGADPSSGQPLFGEGIARAEGSSSGNDGGGSPDGGGSRGGTGAAGAPGSAERGGGEDAASGGRATLPSSRHSAAIEAASADGSDGLLTAGIAGSVLAAGLLVGFGLRRLLKAR